MSVDLHGERLSGSPRAGVGGKDLKFGAADMADWQPDRCVCSAEKPKRRLREEAGVHLRFGDVECRRARWMRSPRQQSASDGETPSGAFGAPRQRCSGAHCRRPRRVCLLKSVCE